MDSIENRVNFLEKTVTAGDKKKYYRFRSASFYGGIATADCVGCPLKCVFCWSQYPRTHPEKAGKWYTSDQVGEKLTHIASRKGYSQVRVSGNEPTVGREHMLNLLQKVTPTYQFILETSGVLIDNKYAEQLSSFENLHVRVSLKGTCEQEFSQLTGASPDGFKTQLYALKALVDHNVSCHPAVMVSFSSFQRIKELEERLSYISSDFYLEKEEVILYSNVKKRLLKANLLPE